VPGFESITSTNVYVRITFQKGAASQQTTSLICTTTWTPQIYTLGNAAISLPPPTCTGSTGSIIMVNQTIAAPHNAFVYVANPTTTPNITIFSVDQTLARPSLAYSVTVISTDFYSQVSFNNTLSVTLLCSGVKNVNYTGSLGPITYNYGAPSLYTPIPTYRVNPNCGAMPIAYSLSLQGGGTVPNLFSVNSTSLMFVIAQGMPVSFQTYTLVLTANETYSSSNPKSNSSCVFNVTITCTQTLSV
jgi:hypothetical protein